MVPPRVGSDFHHRLHVQRAPPMPANPRLGLPPSRRLEESRNPHVGRARASVAWRRGISEKCRRADFCTIRHHHHRSADGIFSSARFSVQRSERPVLHMESRRARRGNYLSRGSFLRPPRGSRTRGKIRQALPASGGIPRRVAASTLSLALGWALEYAARRL